jgi:hypothetical protein
MDTSETIGFLLGAGASYELGMPLTDELTVEFKKSLTRVFDLPYYKTPEAIAKTLESLLNQEDLNYEDVIGRIEIETRRSSNSHLYQKWHGVLGRYLEAIFFLLQERLRKNQAYITDKLELLSPIKEMCKSKPLWVFSLNHDILIEAIAKHYEIPIQFGFNQKTRISGFLFERLTRKEMEGNKFSFIQDGGGINLIKLHGSLDTFVQGDEKNYLKLIDEGQPSLGIIDLIDKLIENDSSVKNGVKCTNEITYNDNEGVLQFLRMTIMSGKHKYSSKVSHSMDDWFFRVFKGHINHVNTLYCIGSSLQDRHVNDVIYEWLSFSESRKLVIVNPHIEAIPNFIIHLYDQVSILKMTFLEFLNSGSDNNGFKILLNKQMRNISRTALLKK